MRRSNTGSVVRKRMLRLKKRKSILRRQQSLREKMLLAKQHSQGLLTDKKDLSAGNESSNEQDLETASTVFLQI